MKKFLVCVVMSLLSIPLFAQRINIETDIFGDLKYQHGDYTAALKKDVFDNLTFTDNNDNKIVFEQKYLLQEYPRVKENNEAKMDFFRQLVRRYRSEGRYETKYSIDIFRTTIITDNRGNKIEKGTDIFGNTTYEEESNGVNMSVKRALNGTLEYRSGGDSASLGKDIFDKWIYKDSYGNKFEFGTKTWNALERRFGNDEEIFWFLINQFIHH